MRKITEVVAVNNDYNPDKECYFVYNDGDGELKSFKWLAEEEESGGSCVVRKVARAYARIQDDWREF